MGSMNCFELAFGWPGNTLKVSYKLVPKQRLSSRVSKRSDHSPSYTGYRYTSIERECDLVICLYLDESELQHECILWDVKGRLQLRTVFLMCPALLSADAGVNHNREFNKPNRSHTANRCICNGPRVRRCLWLIAENGNNVSIIILVVRDRHRASCHER